MGLDVYVYVYMDVYVLSQHGGQPGVACQRPGLPGPGLPVGLRRAPRAAAMKRN
jgi:hypothetical protein